MPFTIVPLGKMNLDRGPSPGDHLWVAKSCFYTQNGYESMPIRKRLGSTFGPGEAPRGVHCWNGAGSQRIYAGFNSSIWEINPTSGSATDVTGNSLTNSTNGVSFASYGEYCFAANGIDEIQQIRVPSALGDSTNFGDMIYTTNGATIAPKYICSHKNHIIAANVKILQSYEEISTLTTEAGPVFTNQPTNDGVEVLSGQAADTTQNVTVYGTRNGSGSTIFVETVNLNGLVAVPTVITDWVDLYGVLVDQTGGEKVGTVTVREASGGLTITTCPVGVNKSVVSAFTNQPSNDGVEILSSAAGDTTQDVTIIGTRTGSGDTVFVESINLDGTNVVSSSSVIWDKILGVLVDQTGTDTVGAVTIREASGNATIAVVGPGEATLAVQNFTPFSGGDGLLDIVASGASTKQIGLMGFNINNVTIFDSQALNGTTTVQSNSRFAGSGINVLTGDLANTTSVTITSHAFPANSEHPYSLWVSGTDDPEGFGSPLTSPTIIGCERLQLFDGEGVISGVIDGGDAFFVFKTNAVYRVDGPPFIPTVISYSVGMPLGSTPYRQDSRIYFWSTRGLFYIDTSTNEIVDVFGTRMSRSITDWANANFQFTIGTYPWLTRTGTSLTHGTGVPSTGTYIVGQANANTGGNARVSGDSKYGWVLVTFANAAYNYNGVVYQSREDAFFLPDGKWNSDSLPVECPATSGDAPFPGSALRLIEDGGASNNLQYWTVAGVGDAERSDDEDMYVLFPFIEKGPSENAVRLTRIRPRLANMFQKSEFPLNGNADAGCFVITKYTSGQNWTTASDSYPGGWSEDGWIEFPDSPWGLAFCIGISPSSNTSSVSPLSLPGEFGAIEIEYESVPSKSE